MQHWITIPFMRTVEEIDSVMEGFLEYYCLYILPFKDKILFSYMSWLNYHICEAVCIFPRKIVTVPFGICRIFVAEPSVTLGAPCYHPQLNSSLSSHKLWAPWKRSTYCSHFCNSKDMKLQWIEMFIGWNSRFVFEWATYLFCFVFPS